MANRTLTLMKSNVGNAVQDTSASMLSLIQNYINDRMKEVYSRVKLQGVLRSDYSFSTTAGTEDYVLPQDFDSEMTVIDTTNKRPLCRLDMQQVVGSFSGQINDQGTTTHYVIMDKTVQNQPSSASTISIVSSSASDTSQTVFIRGYDANGYEDYESVTLVGTTPVVTSASFLRLKEISKSGVTVGTVTLTSNSGAVTNAVLSRPMLDYRIKLMRLVQIPSSVFTVEINYIPGFLEMTQSYDYPLIDCADVLEAGATADALRYKRQYQKASDFDIIFEKRLANLIFTNEAQPNKIQLFSPKPYQREFYTGNADDTRRYGIF